MCAPRGSGFRVETASAAALRGEEVLMCAPHLDQGLGFIRQCCSLRGEEVLTCAPHPFSSMDGVNPKP